MKKIFAILFLLLSVPVWAEEEKVLSIDDFFGVYTSDDPESMSLAITKMDDKIKIINIDTFLDYSHIEHFTCDIDDITDEYIYLECDYSANRDISSYPPSRPYLKLYNAPEKYMYDIIMAIYYPGKKQYIKNDCYTHETFSAFCKVTNVTANRYKGE
ncbi:hypothetical protein HDR60_01090 [bacterium]|nr:hypothetical protein [bacterium]